MIVAVMLSLVVSVSAAPAPVYTVEAPKWVTIDGRVSQQEWGKPIYKGVSLQAAEDGKVDNRVTAWWYDGTHNQDTTFDLYVTNTDENFCVACVVYNVDSETSRVGRPWQHLNFAFTFSKWTPNTGVFITNHKGDLFEQFCGYRLYLNYEGKMGMQSITQGIDAKQIFPGADYSIKYDKTTRTLTYEAAIPYKYSNVSIEEGNEIAFSAVVALDYYGNSVNCNSAGSNRFLVGTGAAKCGGKNNYAHTDQCIKIKLAPFSQIQNAKPDAGGINAPTANTGGFIASEYVDIEEVPNFADQGEDASVSWTTIVFFAAAGLALICAMAILVILILKRRSSRKEVLPE